MTKQIHGQKKFKKYLDSIENGNVFPCPDLVVLPEKVHFSERIIGEIDYKRGSLLCRKTTKEESYGSLSHHCRVQGGVFQRGGKIFTLCGHQKLLEIEVKSVI